MLLSPNAQHGIDCNPPAHLKVRITTLWIGSGLKNFLETAKKYYTWKWVVPDTSDALKMQFKS